MDSRGSSIISVCVCERRRFADSELHAAAAVPASQPARVRVTRYGLLFAQPPLLPPVLPSCDGFALYGIVHRVELGTPQEAALVSSKMGRAVHQQSIPGDDRSSAAARELAKPEVSSCTAGYLHRCSAAVGATHVVAARPRRGRRSRRDCCVAALAQHEAFPARE